MQLLESLELIGPGRWLDRPVVDLRLALDPVECECLAGNSASVLLWLQDTLPREGCGTVSMTGFATADLREHALQHALQPALGPATAAARMLAQTSLLLQASAGHSVQWWDVEAEPATDSAHARFETEDPATGKLAGELAWWLLEQAMQPGLPGPRSPQIQERISEFLDAARQRVFPPEAELLASAARDRDIPVCKLDREPFEPISGDFRRLPNGLLRFGDACHQQVADGTLCLQRSARVIEQLRSAEARRKFLLARGAPVAAVPWLLENPALEHWRFLCAGQQLLAVVDSSGREVTALCHPSWLEMAANLAQQLETGMLVLEAVSMDWSQPLRTTGGFADFDISPRLDTLLLQAPELCSLMANDFIDWMFPPGTPSRIPLFSVTGTNGKTTTCRMLRAIAEEAGYRVGMACTDGIYLAGELIEPGDSSGRDGHHRVLECRQVDLAVLETARGAVLHSGFSFDFSDVAVCTNVSAEHFGEYGIHTVHDMAEIKQLILSRARKAVVLNFDDTLVRRMTATQGARTCWTTLESSPEAISASGLQMDRVLHLNLHGGEEWVISSEDGIATPLLPVGAIPATLQGKARHNLCNTLQAIAAALEMGLPWPAIDTAMKGFAMSFENTPGRLNFHRCGEFDVLMDFVQNYACMEQLCAFTDRLEVQGKRIIVMSVLGRHPDETIREFARLASRSFDHFICRNYLKTFPHRSPAEIPEMLRDELLRCGVPEAHISIELDEAPAIQRALDRAGRGDLVVFLCGIYTQQAWQQITAFTAAGGPVPGTLERVR